MPKLTRNLLSIPLVESICLPRLTSGVDWDTADDLATLPAPLR